MDEEESREVRLEEEQERIMTLKINLEGPAELVSWMRENVPPRRAGRRMFRLLPEEFGRHMRAAQREQLLAVRSLLDAVIQRLEPGEKPERQAKEVEIE